MNHVHGTSFWNGDRGETPMVHNWADPNVYTLQVFQNNSVRNVLTRDSAGNGQPVSKENVGFTINGWSHTVFWGSHTDQDDGCSLNMKPYRPFHWDLSVNDQENFVVDAIQTEVIRYHVANTTCSQLAAGTANSFAATPVLKTEKPCFRFQ